MARNIIIDPQRTGTSNPNIQFSGSAANTIRLEVLPSGSLQFSGAIGPMMILTDNTSSLLNISGTFGIHYSPSQGAVYAPKIFWRSSLGHEIANIWANDTILPSTGVLYIANNTSGSNARYNIFDAGSGGNTLIDTNWLSISNEFPNLEPSRRDTFFEISGGIGTKNTTTRGITLFRGDVHVSGNISIDGFTAGRYSMTGTTTNATPSTLWTLNLTNNSLYDLDFSILAVGTGSGVTKRFKRNVVVANYSSTASILENSTFVPIPDVSGSNAASSWNVELVVSASSLLVNVTGSASQTIKWIMNSDSSFGTSS